MKKTVGFSVVALQFRFTNRFAIPPFTRRMMIQTTKKNTALQPGELVIEPIDGSSVGEVLLDLEKEGFALINVQCEERDTGKGSRHYIARFIFSATEKASESFTQIRNPLKRELVEICTEALWRTRVYVNPLTDNRRGASIVLDTRTPFVHGDGRPVTVRAKDPATGERVGAPLPLSPSHHLHLLSASDFILMEA